MAEAILKDLLARQEFADTIEVSSGGLAAMSGDMMAAPAQEVLADLWHIDGSMHRSSGLRSDRLDEQDLILTMTHAHAAYLYEAVPELKERIHTLSDMVRVAAGVLEERGLARDLVSFVDDGDIADPYGQSYAVYEDTAQKLRSYLEILVAYLALDR